MADDAMPRSPVPTSNAAFSSLMQRHAALNDTLLRHLYPTAERIARMRFPDPRRHWVPFTANCEAANDCYCFHVAGEMSFSRGPHSWKKCMHHHTWPNVGRCPAAQDDESLRSCGCLTDIKPHRNASTTARPRRAWHPCLYTDMRPSKLLAVLVAARAAGATHIVEEGRYGGLTALYYALHGLQVTSIEFLPLTGPSEALRQLVPDRVTQLEGDGAALVPQLINAMSDVDAAHTAVVFDGEKRLEAWATYRKLHRRVALAVFDDTDNGNDPPKPGEQPGPAYWNRSPFFERLRQEGQTWWSTFDDAFAPFLAREDPALRLLEPLQALRSKSGGALKWWGGVKSLGGHFTIVRGAAWQ